MRVTKQHIIKLSALFLVAAIPLCAVGKTKQEVLPAIFSNSLSGSVFNYEVKSGDYVALISARFGAPHQTIIEENKLAHKRYIHPGQILSINNTHIVPDAEPEKEIVINLPQRMLFHFNNNELQSAYPIAIGKPTWPTPPGSFNIINRQENKPWFVPKSIQEEMRNEGKVVKTIVPSGPENPLGKHWLGLSIPGYGIHGTISPVSIFRFRSHGCIRLHPEDIEAFFGRVSVGTEGTIIYNPVLLALLPDNRVFLEVHEDKYEQAVNSIEIIQVLADEKGISSLIDWNKAKDIVRRQEGVAREVTLNAGKQDSLSEEQASDTRKQQPSTSQLHQNGRSKPLPNSQPSMGKDAPFPAGKKTSVLQHPHGGKHPDRLLGKRCLYSRCIDGIESHSSRSQDKPDRTDR